MPLLLTQDQKRFRVIGIKIKLLTETKPIVCLPWEILHYKISKEKLEPEPGFEPRASGFLARRSPLEQSWFSCQLMFKSPS